MLLSDRAMVVRASSVDCHDAMDSVIISVYSFGVKLFIVDIVGTDIPKQLTTSRSAEKSQNIQNLYVQKLQIAYLA